MILFALLAFACKKTGEPDCIRSEIKNFEKTNGCVSAKVDEYTFQGKTVYVFDPGQCGADMTSSVMDSGCGLLGHLGGISGNTTINGDDFTKAVFVRNVWRR